MLGRIAESTEVLNRLSKPVHIDRLMYILQKCLLHIETPQVSFRIEILIDFNTMIDI